MSYTIFSLILVIYFYFDIILFFFHSIVMKKMLSLLAAVVLMFQTMMPINAWFAVDVQAFKNATSEYDVVSDGEPSDVLV